jgi:hypothetical protein
MHSRSYFGKFSKQESLRQTVFRDRRRACLLVGALLALGITETSNSLAAESSRDRVVEAKDKAGNVFLRVTTTYVGKAPDPAFPSATHVPGSNSDYFSRTFENLGSTPIEFIKTSSFRGDGKTAVIVTGNDERLSGMVVTNHSERPKFGRSGNVLAPGQSLTQRNLFATGNNIKRFVLIDRVLLTYGGNEYSVDDERNFFER